MPAGILAKEPQAKHACACFRRANQPGQVPLCMPRERFKKRRAKMPFRHALPAFKTVLAVKMPEESARKLLGNEQTLKL